MSSVITNGVSAKTSRGPGPAPTYEQELYSSKGEGWVLFAGIIMFLAASLNMIWGIAAVANSHFFVANASYILSGLNTWGWIAIGLATVQFFAAAFIWRGSQVARWFGIAMAGIALVTAMMAIPAYPLWSLALVALDILVIYALAAYGGKPELAR